MVASQAEFLYLMSPRPLSSTLFPYTTLFRSFVYGGTAQNTGTAVAGSMQIHAAQKASTVEKLNLEYQDGEWQVQVQYRDENNESAVATYQFDANDTETVIDLRDEIGRAHV